MVSALVLHSVVPVRTEPKEQAEQSTQLLFGQMCTVLSQQKGWVRICGETDGEKGWVDSKMITILSDAEEAEFVHYKRTAQVKVPMTYAVSENNGQTIPLVAGTHLPNYEEGKFSILGVPFRIDPAMVSANYMEMNAENLMEVVRFFLNTPYQWGGKNALGMDCSGFCQIILGLFGRALPRNARDQAKHGRPVRGLRNAKMGDLVFFNHGEGKITHVGLLLDKDRVVHCSGRVKVERLDECGIWNVEENRYSHSLVRIKRFI